MENCSSLVQSQDPSNHKLSNHSISNDNRIKQSWCSNKNICWSPEENLFSLILVSIWLSLALVAIYAIYYQVRRNRDVPVYSINLLISDIVQICCLVVTLTRDKKNVNHNDPSMKTLNTCVVYSCGVMASAFSMIFIALERYLIMASPLWCSYKKKTQVSVLVCAVSWILSVFIGIIHEVELGGFLLFPFPFLIFLLVWTIRAQTEAQSSKEKRRVVAVLAVVLLNYTLMFFPLAIMKLVSCNPVMKKFNNVLCPVVQLNPLTNLLLCVSVMNWIVDKLLDFCF